MYYTIIITDTQAIFRYALPVQAFERYHSELAYAMNQGIPCTCAVMDRHGVVYESKEFIPATE